LTKLSKEGINISNNDLSISYKDILGKFALALDALAGSGYNSVDCSLKL
jgi:hypothetical protein